MLKAVRYDCHRSQLKVCGVSRRTALVGLAGIASSAALGPFSADAREDGGPIDVHHHFFPPVAKALYGPFPPLQSYTVAKSVDAMEEAGVSSAFVSLPAQLDEDTTAAAASAFAREANEYGKQMESTYPARFRLLGFLPLPHLDATLKEIEYLVDTLQVAGIGMLTNYANDWIGEPRFDAVLEELNRRHAIVYVHPTDAPCCMDLLPNTIPHTVEWNTQTSRAIWSVINDGADRPPVTRPTASVATRYPNIRWIWSHAGGTLLGLIGRFLNKGGARNVRPDDLATAERDSKLYHLRRFYYDTALSANPVQMQALKSLVGIDRIVFGSDFPFMALRDTIESLAECGFADTELAAVNQGNVMTLFQ